MQEEVTLVVTGTKSCKDYSTVELAIDQAIEILKITPTKIIHGDTAGVEKLSGEYAKNRGLNCEKMVPKWKDLKDVPSENIKTNKYGKYNSKAAFERNDKMISKASAVIVIDLGTSESDSIIRLAKKQNVPVYEFEPEETDHDFGYNF